jgi:hypothetical protein
MAYIHPRGGRWPRGPASALMGWESLRERPGIVRSMSRKHYIKAAGGRAEPPAAQPRMVGWHGPPFGTTSTILSLARYLDSKCGLSAFLPTRPRLTWPRSTLGHRRHAVADGRSDLDVLVLPAEDRQPSRQKVLEQAAGQRPGVRRGSIRPGHPGRNPRDVMQGDHLRVVHTDGTAEEPTLPVPVQRFMDAFNGGQYPDLVMP